MREALAREDARKEASPEAAVARTEFHLAQILRQQAKNVDMSANQLDGNVEAQDQENHMDEPREQETGVSESKDQEIGVDVSEVQDKDVEEFETHESDVDEPRSQQNGGDEATDREKHIDETNNEGEALEESKNGEKTVEKSGDEDKAVEKSKHEDLKEAEELEASARAVLMRLLPLSPLEVVPAEHELALFDHLQPVFDGRFTGQLLLQYVS